MLADFILQLRQQTTCVMATPSRKRKALTLEEKVKVIRLNEKGESARRIASELDVGKTQIACIIKSREQVLQQWEDGTASGRKILKAQRCQHNDLNTKVYEWFCVARSKNIPVSGKMLQEKAVLFSMELNYDDFVASNGWLYRFQQRHMIKCNTLSGEAADVSDSVVQDWQKRLPDLCRNYSPANIFNCDETGLFYRALPSRSLVQKGESCKGGKQAKDRITVLLCASAAGEKLRPLVIGKSQNPRSFRGYPKTSLGVNYHANTKAWMTTSLFETWLKKLNNQMRTQDRKILLFMDNCGAHPHIELSNIELAFLPPNTTSKLQPMDAGIIQTAKITYRKKLLRHVLFLMDDANTASDIAKQVTILDAILWMRSAWNAVTSDTIAKCFAKCGFDNNQPSTSDTDDNLWDAEDLLPLLPLLSPGLCSCR